MRMKILSALGLFGTLYGAQTVSAQPDIRDVRPLVILLVDSSGSMERMGDCVCTTEDCNECLPNCSSGQKNRWATVVESLTGDWSNFSCAREARVGSGYVSAPDYRYYVPHVFHPGELRPDGSIFAPTVTQANNGILDTYMERAKFGLMTFDGISTLNTADSLVPESVFNVSGYLLQSEGAAGGFSYGGPRPFEFPGCTQPYMIDNGVQNGSTLGSMVSVGSDARADYVAINTRIQNNLMNARPHGPTPIAGMLEDLDFYLSNHPDVAGVSVPGGQGDAFQSCRKRYVVLLTDGYPNADMRGEPYHCEATDAGGACPYRLPAETAADLCDYSAASQKCTGSIDGLFVLGFNVPDAQAVGALNSLAEAGGTCATPGGDCAFLVNSGSGASDVTALRGALGSILNRTSSGTTTRTVPAFSASSLTASTQGQAQFQSGFLLGAEPNDPWSGVLERQRYECDANNIPRPVPVAAQDRFHDVLSLQTNRTIYTVVPSYASNTNAFLVGSVPTMPRITSNTGSPSGGAAPGAGGGSCGGNTQVAANAAPVQSNLQLSAFATTNSALTAAHLGVTTATRAQEIINWVRGVGRTQDLGDIYHSSPVIIGPPTDDLPDESFNRFRRRLEVANRPKILYVGTNDGIMHAFVAENTTITEGPHSGQTLVAGQELWGFVPPAVLKSLDTASTSHAVTVDGTPVVKEVFFRRSASSAPDGNAYHTVLVFGLRGGGGAYVAMDVTDPFEPKFLWQFAHPLMGNSFGTAGLGQVLVEDQSGSVMETSIALLPAGTGVDRATLTCGGLPVVGGDGRLTKPTGCEVQGSGRPAPVQNTSGSRAKIHCWDTTGRGLYFLDIATGEVMRFLDDREFNAPMTGGVAMYTGAIGVNATRAFTTDADGILWRIDLTSRNPSAWDAQPFHDMFWDLTATEGRPAHPAPILSVDSKNRIVVIQATGNVDALDGMGLNRVASVTENIAFGTGGVAGTVSAILNWEIRLNYSEQVTGPLELFDGKVYFSSFQTTGDSTNSCGFGASRIWGVEYVRAESISTQPSPVPVGAIIPDGATAPVRHLDPVLNQVVMGVRVVQRPTCAQFQEVSETDPYLGSRRLQDVSSATRGEFQLVAQVSGGGNVVAGGAVAQFNRSLPEPPSYLQVFGWAGLVD